MKSRKGFTLIELLVVIAIIAILAAILFPVFMRAKQAAMASQCVSNMNQIGKSIKMYLSDWEDTYPSNRMKAPMNTFIANFVALSDPAKVDANKEPIRFESGVNWVEALYPYIEKVAEGDAAAAWKCPAARPIQSGGNFAAVTYSFNFNLVEMSEGVVKNAGNLMMCRELDRMYNAVLRPINLSNTSTTAPNQTFLNDKDQPTSSIKYKLHADGSHILFADGHVKIFPASYYPPTCQWDATQNQWYNFAGTGADPKLQSIAVSP